MNWAFWIATLAQLYIVPLFLIQLFLLTNFSVRTAFVMFSVRQGIFETPQEVTHAINTVSFIPIKNIGILFMVIVISVMMLFVNQDVVDDIILAYQEQSNPLMYKVTESILMTIETLHEVKILKEDEEGFATVGMTGLVLSEDDGMYDVLIPYVAVVTLKKEDVKDVSIKANPK